MKTSVCDICYFEGKDCIPKLTATKYTLTMKGPYTRLKIDACEEHKGFLKNQPAERSIQDIQKEIHERQSKFYGGNK